MKTALLVWLAIAWLAVDGLGQDEPFDEAFAAATAALEARDFVQAAGHWERCLELRPRDSSVAYALARLEAMRQDPDASFRWLELAIEWGFTNRYRMAGEGDLRLLRPDPRFQDLLAALAKKARAATRAMRESLANRRAAGGSDVIEWRDGHTGVVQRARFSPDGNDLITWAEDGRVIRWDTQKGQSIGYLGQYSSWQLTVEFVAGGRRLVVWDMMVQQVSVWDPRSGRLLLEIGGEDHFINGIATELSSPVFVTVDDLGRLQKWDALRARPIGTEALARIQPPVTTCGMTLSAANSAVLINVNGGEIPGYGARLIDLETGRTKFDWVDSEGRSFARFSPDGRRAIVHREITDYLWSDLRKPEPFLSVVEVWELGTEPRRLTRQSTWLPPAWDTDLTQCIDAGGTRLLTEAATDNGHELRLWQVGEERPLWVEGIGTPTSIRAAVRGDGRRVAVGLYYERPAPFTEGRFVILDSEGHRITDHLIPEGTGRPDAGRVTFWPNGELAGWHGGSVGSHIFVAAAEEGGPASHLFRESTIYDLRPSPVDRRLAITGWPEWAAVLTPGEEGLLPLRSRALSARSLTLGVFDPSAGSPVLIGAVENSDQQVDLDQGRAVLIDSENGGVLRSLPEANGRVTQACFSPDASRFSVSSNSGHWVYRASDLGLESSWPVNGIGHAEWASSGRFQVLTSMTSTGIVYVLDESSRTIIGQFSGRTWPRFDENPWARCSPVEDIFAYVKRSGGIQVFDLVKGVVRAELSTSSPTKILAFSPDGRWLAAGARELRTWRTSDWVLEGQRGYEDPILWTTFSPDSRMLAVGTEQGGVDLITLGPGATPDSLLGHTDSTAFVDFSPDGRRLVSCSRDGTAKLWDTGTKELISVCTGHTAEVRMAVFTHGGDRLATVGGDGTFRFWEVTTGKLLSTLVVQLDDEWLQFEPSGFYRGTSRSADWARAIVDGQAYPLSSYASLLQSPETVEKAHQGERIEPHLPLSPAPDVRILSPDPGALSDRSFRLRLEGEDAIPIERFRVTINGEEQEVESDLVLERERRDWIARQSVPLTIPSREATISVRAENELGILSWPEEIEVRYEASARDLYLLAIGVADYEDDHLDLAYPIQDVSQLVARFAKEQGRFFDNVYVETLLDSEVTGSALRRLREKHLRKAQPDDTILVFVAGHGVRSESGEYYFLTPAATPDDPYAGIERSQLESLVTWDKLYAQRKVLLIDTCHSGEAYGEAGKRGLSRQDAFDQDEVEAARRSGLYIIAASAEQGFAQESEGNGIFTRALLDGLDGAADKSQDGIVTIDELREFAANRVHERSHGRQRPTTPRIEGGEDFGLARVR